MTEHLHVNRELVWDYDVPDDADQDDAFRRWYVARVLTRGRGQDIRDIGLRTISAYLPYLVLPARVRRFWEWYFSVSEEKERHGSSNPTAA